MANSFQQAQQEALGLINKLQTEVTELDKQLIATANNLVKMFKFGGVGQTQNQIKVVTDEFDRLNKIIKEQNEQLKNLNKTKQANAQRTSEEIVNQRALAKAADTEAKSTSKLIGAYGNLNAKRLQARKALRDAIVLHGKNSREVRKATILYNKYNKKVLQANKATSNFSKTGLGNTIKGLKMLIGAFGLAGGIALFTNFARKIFELTKTFDGLKFALERVSGDMLVAAESSRFLLQISQDFGAELVTTTNRWIKFLAAAKQSGLTLRDTENIFRSMTKAAGVLGLKTDELQGIYLALEQMLSKGKVTTEELRRQLGERLPGAMGIMAASMGVTIVQLDKMLKKGEVLSAEVLPNFATAVELAFGIESVEKVDTLVAAQNRLTTSWQNFVSVVFSQSGELKAFFNDLAGWINKATLYFGGDTAQEAKAFADATKSFEEELNKRAKLALEQTEGYLGLEEKLKAEKLRIQEQLNTAEIRKDKEKQDELKALQDKNQKELIEYYLERQKLVKKEAFEQIDNAEKNFLKEKDLIEKLRAIKEAATKGEINVPAQNKRLLEELNKQDFDGVTEPLLRHVETIDDLNNVLDEQARNYGRVKAIYEVYAKSIEEGNVATFDPNEDGSGSRKAFKVDAEKQALFEIEKLRKEASIRQYEALVKNTDLELEVRENANKTLREKEIDLTNFILENKLWELEEKRKYEKAAVGTDANQRKLEEEKELQERIAIYLEYTERMKKIRETYLDAEIEDVTDSREELDLALKKAITKERNRLIEQGETREEIDRKLLIFEKRIQKEGLINFLKTEKAKLEAVKKTAEKMGDTKRAKRAAAAIAELEEQISLASLPEKVDKNLKKMGDSLKNFFESFTDDVLGNAGFDMMNEMFNTSVWDEAEGKWVSTWDSMMNTAEKGKEKFALVFNAVSQMAQEAFNFMAEMSNQRFAIEFDNLEKEKEIAILFAGESTAAKEEIERQYEEKRKKIQKRQAKAEKDQAIFNIAIDTAQALVGLWASPGFPAAIPLMAVVGALGAAQLAMVSSTPVPEFFRGTMNAPEGWANVDEKRPEVHTDRQGRIKSLGQDKANKRWLERGDRIYSSHEEYFKKELGGVLQENDIVPYNMFDMPSINIEKGMTAQDLKREISGLKRTIREVEPVNINMDKRGFQSSFGRKNILNNQLRIKRRRV